MKYVAFAAGSIVMFGIIPGLIIGWCVGVWLRFMALVLMGGA
jgi:hypothetical protein